MKSELSRLGIAGLLTLVGFTSCVEQPKDELVLFDFENDFHTGLATGEDADIELIEDGENHLLKVNTGSRIREPGVILKPATGAWDLSDYQQVSAEVCNTGEKFMKVQLFVGNSPDRRTRYQSSHYVDLEPGETKTISVNLAWTPWIFEPQLNIGGMRGIPGKVKMDLEDVRELKFIARYAESPREFTIDRVRAVGNYEIRDTAGFFPFVDEFGQYIHKDWMGKMHTMDELMGSIDFEQQCYEDNPGPENRSRFGGWTAGPRLEGTGFFRTEKYKGKWWMVDPEGYLFWSAGMNCVVSEREQITGITSREHYYKYLPERGGGLGQFYGELADSGRESYYTGKGPYTTYNFYQSNLYRKYGNRWLDEFRNLAHQRFRSWGMNTLGFVSDTGAMKQRKTPYVGSVWVRGTVKIKGSKEHGDYWKTVHDVFDPGFRHAVRTSMEAQKDGANDPWCIGFYVDNELAWGKLGSFSLFALESPANQPAKIEFLKDLREKYGTIEELNKTWGTSHDSWEILLQFRGRPDPEKAMEDLAVFYEKFAETYFRIIEEELARIAPNQCYLGVRFAWSNNEVTLRAGSKYIDIMSFNKYETHVADLTLPKGVDKPVIIGEWHCGALDRGHFHPGLKEVNDQAARGVFYQNYIQSALNNPLIVGAHWFQYIDQSITGRRDGENYNVGFIDVCDNPYYEVIDKVRQTNYQMYENRFNNQYSQK